MSMNPYAFCEFGSLQLIMPPGILFWRKENMQIAELETVSKLD